MEDLSVHRSDTGFNFNLLSAVPGVNQTCVCGLEDEAHLVSFETMMWHYRISRGYEEAHARLYWDLVSDAEKLAGNEGGWDRWYRKKRQWG